MAMASTHKARGYPPISSRLITAAAVSCQRNAPPPSKKLPLNVVVVQRLVALAANEKEYTAVLLLACSFLLLLRSETALHIVPSEHIKFIKSAAGPVVAIQLVKVKGRVATVDRTVDLEPLLGPPELCSLFCQPGFSKRFPFCPHVLLKRLLSSRVRALFGGSYDKYYRVFGVGGEPYIHTSYTVCTEKLFFVP